jgi:hypothetical protein
MAKKQDKSKKQGKTKATKPNKNVDVSNPPEELSHEDLDKVQGGTYSIKIDGLTTHK